MNALTTAVLLGWPLVMLALCARFGTRRALILGFVAGWLALPVASLSIHGFFDLDKSFMISLGALVAVAISDPLYLSRFRLHWIDLPVALLCIGGLISAIANGIPFYEGCTELARLSLQWAVPWFLGRLCFTDLESFQWFAKCFVVGGLIYAPMCLWEVRMSPSLHREIYGTSVYNGIAYLGSLGSWGSRPSVFMRNPLELGMVMMPACLFAIVECYQAYRRGKDARLAGLVAAFLAGVGILCKNLGATILLAAGAAVFFLTVRRRSFAFVALLGLAAPSYMIARGTGIWDGHEIVTVARFVHADRADSYSFRLMNENALVAKALEHPLLGWSGWGRSRVYDEEGRDVSVTDGLWVIGLGMYGLLGLVCLVLMLILPMLRLMQSVDRRLLDHSATYPLIASGTVLLLMTLDFLANNFPSPPLLLMAGGLVGVRPIAVHPGAGADRHSKSRTLVVARR